MQVTIEYTTGSYDYQVLKGDADFDESFEDNPEVLELVERLHNSTTYDEREEIAEKLWEECGYNNASRMLYPEGQLEVTYKRGDEEDINDLSYEILDNDWVEFDEFFEEDIKKCSFCIIKNSFAKRAHYYLKTELDEPFSGEYLKIANGGISYKGEELEWTGDAGGWFEEEGVYVFGSDEIEEEESKKEESEDIELIRHNKIRELFAEELDAHQKRSDKIDQIRDRDRFSLWKQCGIPDNGESSWQELSDELDDDLNHPYDRYLESLDCDDPRKKQWDKGWSEISGRIWEMNGENRHPLDIDALNHYKHATNIDYINSWDESTKQKILSMQKDLDQLEKWVTTEKIEQFHLLGYSMYENYYDDEKEKSIIRPCTDWDNVDVEESIKKYMDSIGQDDYEEEYLLNQKTDEYEYVRGEDYEKLINLRVEWRKKEESIDDTFQKRRNSIIHNDDNY